MIRGTDHGTMGHGMASSSGTVTRAVLAVVSVGAIGGSLAVLARENPAEGHRLALRRAQPLFGASLPAAFSAPEPSRVLATLVFRGARKGSASATWPTGPLSKLATMRHVFGGTAAPSLAADVWLKLPTTRADWPRP